MSSELMGRMNFYIEKLSGRGWLMPNTVQTLKDARDHIVNLETLCDPAGIVAENALLKDQTKQLDVFISNRKERIEQLETALQKLLSVKGDHMTACDRTMGATHPCTCGANEARQLIAGIRAPQNRWTTQLPTRVGWYWWRGEEISPKVMHIPFTEPEVTCATANQQYGLARSIGGKWSPEPIPLPDGDTGHECTFVGNNRHTPKCIHCGELMNLIVSDTGP